MAGQAITSVNVAEAIVKLVSVQSLPALIGNLVMGNLVNRNYEPELASSGDTVNVPIPAVATSYNINEGTTGTVTLQANSLGNAQIVLNVHAESSFQIPDVTKVLAIPTLLQMYMQPAMIAIATRIEQDLLNLYPNLNANTAVGTGAQTMTESVVDAGETALFSALVPESVQKCMVVSAGSYSDLRQISRFTEMDKGIDGQPIASGTLGRLKNFLVFRSQYTPVVAGTTYNLGFARDAVALAMRRLPMPMPGTGAVAAYAELNGYGMRIVMSYAPNTLAQQFTVDVLYGVGVLRNVFGIQMLS